MGILLIVTYLQQEYVLIPSIQNMDIIDNSVKSKILEQFFKYRWSAFVLMPIVLLLRISFTAICLYVGGVFGEMENKITLKNSYNIAIKSDIIFVIYSSIGCVIMVILGNEEAISILKYFSLAFLVNLSDSEQWLSISLNTINVFEISYWLLLAKIVKIKTIKQSFCLFYIHIKKDKYEESNYYWSYFVIKRRGIIFAE